MEPQFKNFRKEAIFHQCQVMHFCWKKETKTYCNRLKTRVPEELITENWEKVTCGKCLKKRGVDLETEKVSQKILKTQKF